jgi:hypothetical protein
VVKALDFLMEEKIVLQEFDVPLQMSGHIIC